MAARAYNVAEFYLNGKKHALLNFPELIDHIPHPISLSPSHIQAAAAEAAVALSSGRSCHANKRTRRSPGNPPKNALISGSITGAALSFSDKHYSKNKMIKDAITGGAIATAAEFIRYFT